MSEVFSVSPDEIFHQLKLSCQIPLVVEGIISRQIIDRAAQEAEITVESSELQQAADSWRLINKLQNVDDTWLWLQKHHLSLEEFEELIHNTIIASKLAEHLFASQVEPFFLEHQLDYAGAIVSEIILDNEDLAMELYYALTESESGFAEIAYQYVKDPELRRRGGYRGILYRKDLKPEISAAIFAATPPQVLEPIVTSNGIYLIKVLELIEPHLTPRLRQSILSNLFGTWLKQQIDQVDVKVTSNAFSKCGQSTKAVSNQLAQV